MLCIFLLQPAPALPAERNKNGQEETLEQLKGAKQQSLSAAQARGETASVQAGKSFQGSLDRNGTQSLLKFQIKGDGGFTKSYSEGIGAPIFSRMKGLCPAGAIQAPDGGCVAGKDVTPDECRESAEKAKANLLLSVLLFLGAAGLIAAGIILGWTGIGLALAMAAAVALMGMGGLTGAQGFKAKDRLKQNAACGLKPKEEKAGGIGAVSSSAGSKGRNSGQALALSAKSAASGSAGKAGVSGESCADKYDREAAKCKRDHSNFNEIYNCRRAASRRYDACMSGDEIKPKKCRCACGVVLNMYCEDKGIYDACARACRKNALDTCRNRFGEGSAGYRNCVCSMRDGKYDEQSGVCLGIKDIKQACGYKTGMTGKQEMAYLDCMVADGCNVPSGVLETSAGQQAYVGCLRDYLAPLDLPTAKYLCFPYEYGTKRYDGCVCMTRGGSYDGAGECRIKGKLTNNVPTHIMLPAMRLLNAGGGIRSREIAQYVLSKVSNRFEYVDELDPKAGYYDPKKKVIYLSRDAKNWPPTELAVIIGHEGSHAMQAERGMVPSAAAEQNAYFMGNVVYYEMLTAKLEGKSEAEKLPKGAVKFEDAFKQAVKANDHEVFKDAVKEMNKKEREQELQNLTHDARFPGLSRWRYDKIADPESLRRYETLEQQEGKLFNKIFRREELKRAREEYERQELLEKQWMKDHQEEFKRRF